MNKTLKLILVNSIVLIVLFLIVDVGYGLFLRHTSKASFLRYCSHKQLLGKGLVPKNQPHRYLGYCPTPDYQRGKNRHNSLGYRGGEISYSPDSVYRIICIGGSTTYGNGVEDFKESYPFLLERYLNENGMKAEVINAGAGSYTSYESLINFEFRLLDLDPDMIIVYHGVNDIHSRIVWPAEAYKGDNSGRRAPLIQEQMSFLKIMVSRSNILRTFAIRSGKMRSPAGLNKIDPYPESLHLYTYKNQYESGIYPEGIFKQVSVKKMLDNNSPEYFRRNLYHLTTLATANDIEVVLATFLISPDFPHLMEGSELYLNAIEQHNDVVKGVTIETGAKFFDFASVKTFQKDDFVDAIHLNRSGNEKKAAAFGSFLLSE